MAKGQYMHECNRTACDNKHASYYNHSTEKYYCKSCAMTINLHNKADAMRLYGHDLCTPFTQEHSINPLTSKANE